MGEPTRGQDRATKTDRLLEVLADSDRREVVQYFEDQQDAPVATLDDVVAHLERTLPDDTRKIRLTLRHVHLPKLEAADWVDYDPRSEQVRYHGNPDATDLLDDLLELFDE